MTLTTNPAARARCKMNTTPTKMVATFTVSSFTVGQNVSTKTPPDNAAPTRTSTHFNQVILIIHNI